MIYIFLMSYFVLRILYIEILLVVRFFNDEFLRWYLVLLIRIFLFFFFNC